MQDDFSVSADVISSSAAFGCAPSMPLLIQLFGEIISQSAGGRGGDALLMAAHSQSRSPDLTHPSFPPVTSAAEPSSTSAYLYTGSASPDSFFFFPFSILYLISSPASFKNLLSSPLPPTSSLSPALSSRRVKSSVLLRCARAAAVKSLI